MDPAFGPAGAIVVAAWLVEAKQQVVENIAPVLTRVFTPITIVMLVALFVAVIASGSVVTVERDLLILMDLILVLVLGLLLYSISAQDPHAAPNVFDLLQVVLIAAALAVDLLMLTAMASRIAEFGFTANKVTALGLNLVLMVNLVWAARLGVAFLRGGRAGFAAVERWQTRYLPPAYCGWQCSQRSRFRRCSGSCERSSMLGRCSFSSDSAPSGRTSAQDRSETARAATTPRSGRGSGNPSSSPCSSFPLHAGIAGNWSSAASAAPPSKSERGQSGSTKTGARPAFPAVTASI